MIYKVPRLLERKLVNCIKEFASVPPARKSMNRVSFYNLTTHHKGVDGAEGGRWLKLWVKIIV